MSFRHAQKEATERRDPMQELTDRIAEMIESTGKVPWKREWDSSKCAGPQAPVNAFTGELYHGINTLSFGLDPRAIISSDPRWATFKQAADEHCNVKKGGKSVLGIFYKPMVVEDEKAKDGKRTIPLLKIFHAFHASEIEGLPPYRPPSADEAPWTRPDAVQTIIKNCGVAFRSGGDRAFYSPTHDFIQLPPDVAFPTPEYWSATAVHEIGHSTGHPTRMNRDLTGKFGSESYCSEEAKVEISAAIVCNQLNLPTDFENHSAYVAGWLKKLRADKHELFRCAAEGQRIADWILNLDPDYCFAHPGPSPDRPGPVSPQLTHAHIA